MAKVKGHAGAPISTQAISTGPTSKAQLQPNLRHQSQHQLLTHTCTAHGRLGTPTCQIFPVAHIMLPGSSCNILLAKKFLHVWLPRATPSSTFKLQYQFSLTTHACQCSILHSWLEEHKWPHERHPLGTRTPKFELEGVLLCDRTLL